MRKNTDQKNSEYGHFSCCASYISKRSTLTLHQHCKHSTNLLMMQYQPCSRLRFHIFSFQVDNDEVIIMDGIQRSVITVNNTIPGPPIIASEDQELIVHVTNHLLSDAVTIHWHGLHQRDTPFMDGVAYVTQCPINAGQKFTYKFKVLTTTILRNATYFLCIISIMFSKMAIAILRHQKVSINNGIDLLVYIWLDKIIQRTELFLEIIFTSVFLL